MSTRPPTLNSATSLELPHCVATASSEGSYILALASTSSAYAALATNSADSAQGNGIHLYTLTPGGFTRTQGFPIGTGGSPSAMRVVNNFCGRSMLLSSHQKPGCIKVWDDRCGPQPVSEIHTPKNRALMSFDVSSTGNMLAAGTDLQFDDVSIFYWDPRNTAQPLHVHSSTHSDDITALHFHPDSETLLSASSDGLLSLSDSSMADEDEAVTMVANWGCSIARAGWFPRYGDRSAWQDYGVWSASDMETFGLWDVTLQHLVDFGDVRQPTLPGRWATDYLVDVCYFSPASGPCGTSGLTLFLGSNSGDVALASLSDGADTQPTWTIKGILRGVHSNTVVRSMLWDDTDGVLLTGDESGQLAAWRPAIDGDVEMANAETSNVGTGIKRPREDLPDEGTKRGRFES